jgi:hypothetical protein
MSNVFENIKTAGSVTANSVAAATPFKTVDISTADYNTTNSDGFLMVTASPADRSHRVVVHPMSGVALTVTKTLHIVNASPNIIRVGCQYSPSNCAVWNGSANWAEYTDVPPGTLLDVLVFPAANPAVVSCIPRIMQPQSNHVNARSFGAVGNGSNDDTTALRNAFMFGEGTRPCTIYIPPGRYKITDTLPVPSNVRIVGDGMQRTIIAPTYLYLGPAAGVFVAKCIWDNYPAGTVTTGFKNITLEGLSIDIFATQVNPKDNIPLPVYSFSNGTLWFYPPMQADGAAFKTLLQTPAQRCTNLTLRQIEVIGGPYHYGAYLDNFGRYANGEWNVNIGGVDGVLIEGCRLRGSGRDTLNMKANTDVVILNNTIWDSEDDCIAIGTLAADDNYYYHPAQAGAVLRYTFDGTIPDTNVQICNNNFKQGSTYGVKLHRVDNVLISNNIFNDMNMSAIIIEGPEINRVVISKNTANNIGRYMQSVLNHPTDGRRPFVVITTNGTFSHLIITDNAANTPTSLLEVAVTCRVQYGILANNTLTGSTTAVVVNGSPTATVYQFGVTNNQTET